MPLIDSLESRLGRFAIPGLVQIVALFQLGVVALVFMMKKEAAAGYLEMLSLNMSKVMDGQVWRLITHVFIPRQFSLIWAVFGTLIMMWIGRGLEEAWGAFRVNLYVLGWMVAVTLGNLLLGWPAEALFLYQTLFFAFAFFYPNEEIYVYFVLPVKIKYLAWLTAGLTLLSVLAAPSLLLMVILGHLNFLVAFGASFITGRVHQMKVSDRRARHQAAQMIESSYFHQCQMCKKTELDDRSLDFRVTADGDEICNLCRNKISRAPH